MIINDQQRKELLIHTEEFIKKTYAPKLTEDPLNRLIELRRDIDYILDKGSTLKLPNWFQVSFENVIAQFLNLCNNVMINTNGGQTVFIVHNALTYNVPAPNNGQGQYYSIPQLKTYIDTEWNKSLLDSKQHINDFYIKLEEATAQFNALKESFEVSLTTLNKEVGKVGVKLYADIFERQALEHSSFFKAKDENKDVKWYRRIGKAQTWIVVGMLFTVVLICLFQKLDDWFPLVEQLTTQKGSNIVVTNSTAYTPTIVVHMLSRIVTISFCIFFISFAFKQYRVNMHLYTLNKHRANTLKSFEYLTKAPDPLEPASYNAILMKVAESIYDAGQTGYISTSDTNHDMPSIIDMTKIITPQGK